MIKISNWNNSTNNATINVCAIKIILQFTKTSFGLQIWNFMVLSVKNDRFWLNRWWKISVQKVKLVLLRHFIYSCPFDRFYIYLKLFALKFLPYSKELFWKSHWHAYHFVDLSELILNTYVLLTSTLRQKNIEK